LLQIVPKKVLVIKREEINSNIYFEKNKFFFTKYFLLFYEYEILSILIMNYLLKKFLNKIDFNKTEKLSDYYVMHIYLIKFNFLLIYRIL